MANWKSLAKKIVPAKPRYQMRGFVHWVNGKLGYQYDLKKDINLTGVKLVGDEKYGGQRVYINDLHKKKNPVVLSFGIGEDISFDKDVINKFGAKVYAFDPTPRAAEYVEKQKMAERDFHFYECALGAQNSKVEFGIPSDSREDPSGSVYHKVDELKVGRTIKVEMKRLSTIMKELNLQHIDLLKMDIEGSEFEVIDDFLNDEIFPEQICLEFHERFFPDGKAKMAHAIDKLHENGYKIFAISPMRWEVSFLRITEQ